MFRRIFGAFALLILIAGCAFLFLEHKGAQLADEVFDVSVPSSEVPVNAETLAHGKHLAKIWGCADCHGENFAGQPLFDMPLARVVASNITYGQGGLSEDFSDTDWERAIRYGLDQNGRMLLIMSSNEWTTRSAYDVGSLIAYMKSVPPVDNTLKPSTLKPIGRVLSGVGQLHMWSAQSIDFSATPSERRVPEATVSYGKYIAQSCMGCHGDDLKGRPASDPNAPAPPDITASGPLSSWSKDQVLAAITTGKKPNGEQMDPTRMPWKAFSHYTHVEQEALYQFLRSLK